MRRTPTLPATAALVVALAALAPEARAQAPLNAVVSFTLPTTAGVRRSISQYRGRVVVVFYEDRGSTSHNEHVKQAIGRAYQADPSLARRFALVAVANVGAYNFWPARYFASEAITTIARANRVELWFDWTRALQSRLRLRDGASNVVAIARHGRVRYHRWGRMPASELPGFITLLRTLADEP